MPKRRWQFILPLAFSVFELTAIGLLLGFGSDMPVWLTNVLSLSFVPFLPLIPLLRPLGLIAGYGAITTPNLTGFVVSMVVFIFALAVLGRSLDRRLDRGLDRVGTDRADRRQ